MGDRSDSPLFVALCTQHALLQHSIQSQVFYGQAAWIEILDDQSVQWAGCWGDHIYFWLATQFGEVVDLNANVAYKKRAHQGQAHKPLYSPPNLWSKEIPKFYHYIPEGVAEVELTDPKDQERLKAAQLEITSKCQPPLITPDEEFPNEPMICPGRKVLDDSKRTFKHFDRALSVVGIPPSPFDPHLQ
jgi:hypothetical protein